MSGYGPDEWAERERLDHIAQQHDEDRVAKERELEGRLSVLEAEVGAAEVNVWRKRAEEAEAALEAAEDLAARQRQDDRAELAEAEAQIRTANAAIARVRALHVNEYGSCAECTSVHSALWPCPTIVTLDQSGEPS